MSNSEHVSFKLHSKGAKPPCYMTAFAACADLFLPEYVEIAPHSTKKVPLDISFDMCRGQHIELFARSSLLVKRGLLSPVSIIDTDYKGIVHVVLHNTTDDVVRLEAGERVCQARICSDFPKAVNWDKKDADRDQDGFGGTGL